MCRIAGLITNKLQSSERVQKVTSMCDALQHGGPDDSGIYCSPDKSVTFGHRRLAIIDLSTNGHQPMSDTGLKAWITFNGEIYNYLSLKTELQSLGAIFKSDTDTEVIIQAYLYWGTKSFSKLKGMFVFALYDTVSQSVYLVRDTTGIKPLYYHTEHDQLSFSSEIRAFKAGGITTEKEERWPVWLLAFGHIPEPYSTLKNVFSIPKGHFLCWQKNSTYTIKNYTSISAENYITDLHQAQSGIKHYLKAAVKRQLIADAPIGVFLSGGIDSSLITLLANEERNPLKTVSIFFNEKQYDERRYQANVLEKINGENFTHLVKQQDFEEHLPQILNAMDMPTTDGINTWFISKYAHEDGLKTVLSGVGADELFGGYPSFSRMQYLNYLKALPSVIFSVANLLGVNRYKKFSYLSYNNSTADYLFMRGIYTPSDIAQLINSDKAEVANIIFDAIKTPAPATYNKLYAAYLETNIYMQNQLLHDTDTMSMNHGLEVRVPYLDEDLQNYISHIDPVIRFSNQPKKILIDTFKDTLPKTILDRPKMGFTFPLQQWMANSKVICNYNLYKGNKAKGLITKFSKGQTHWSKAFALYHVQGHV